VRPGDGVVLKRLVRDESGIALVMALMVMTVLAIVTTTAIYYSQQSEHSSTASSLNNEAYRLAETGMNNALATLGYSQTNALNGSALPSSQAAASSQTYPTGTANWWGVLDSTTRIWRLYGQGVVVNPLSTGRTTSRTISASMQVTYSYQQPVNTQAWNYIYLTNSGGPNVCDVTISNNAQVDAPVYASGNLCFGNNTNIRQDLVTPTLPISVIVKGKIQWANNGSSIGMSSSNLVNSAYVAGGCGSTLSAVHTCKAYPTSGYDPIYATTFATTPPNVPAPTVDWTTPYGAADPGPTHPCTTITGTPPAFESTNQNTNNTIQNISGVFPNGSITTTTSLTPASSYTCRTAGGELSWNATTHTMIVKGELYIDGSVTIGDGSVDEYNGQATLYASGTITVHGTMCGKRNPGGTACDFTGWNPNTEMWILAAHGTDANGQSILFPDSSGDDWEGGVYANGLIQLANNATIEGPMIAGGTTISNNVTLQPFPVITNLPLGAPGNPNVYAQPNPPGGYSG
jgi:Tfp pilus assembly protein PilX